MLPLLVAGGYGLLATAASLAEPEGSMPTRSTGTASLSSGQIVPVTLTAYYPKTSYASAAEARMEGGMLDARDRPLITFQAHQRDPRTYPYTSLSGNLKTRFKYGQLVYLTALGTPPPWWTAITGSKWYLGRIVDTGCHFYNDPTAKQCGPNGAVEVIRTPGHVPIDVAMEDTGPKFGVVRATMALASDLPSNVA